METSAAKTNDPDYDLEDQVGFVLRMASQRHASIFQTHMCENLTPTQFTTLIRLAEVGRVSQNKLGRMAAMDVATIKGVVDRLKAKKLVLSEPDQVDKRRTLISLSETGKALIAELKAAGVRITAQTLAPLTPKEQKTLLALLHKIS
ncbi:MAG: MarR family transcriptional regulator [Sulfitobacter sp.]